MFWVKEAIDTVAAVTGIMPTIKMAPRRNGDPAWLIADSRMAREKLSWIPEYFGLHDIIGHA